MLCPGQGGACIVNGGSYEGHAMGRSVILDIDEKEVIQAGEYYSTGQTNNEAKSFAVQDTL